MRAQPKLRDEANKYAEAVELSPLELTEFDTNLIRKMLRNAYAVGVNAGLKIAMEQIREHEVEPLKRDKCDSCARDDEGLHLAEYEDPGDPSVGYGPITELLCDDCAKHLGLLSGGDIEHGRGH